jgi:hypothetical protein
MRVKTDTKFIARKVRLGKYSSLAGLAILSVGMVISFSKPELFEVSLLCLIIGFGVASVGSYNVSRWVKPPRGDEVLEKALKGLSNKYQLFNYVLPSPHVLLAPFGVYVLSTKKQDGRVTYTSQGKWRQDKDIKRRFRLFFGGEQPLGDPASEMAGEVSTIQKYLSRNLPGEDIQVRGAVVFLSPNLVLNIEATVLPVLVPKDIKKFLADEQKERPNWTSERYNQIAQLLDNPVK